MESELTATLPRNSWKAKLHRQHMMVRLYAACQGCTLTALCWSTLGFQCHYMVHFRGGKTPYFFPFLTQRKCSSPPIYISNVFPLMMVSSLCLCFNLGKNLANWPYSNKCTDTSLMFRQDDIHRLNFQGRASVLCWKKARVHHTCQAWVFDHSAHFISKQAGFF